MTSANNIFSSLLLLLMLLASGAMGYYDYFEFSLQWLPTVCNSEGYASCSDKWANETDFTINSLRPMGYFPPSQQQQFKPSLITALQDQLEQKWPDVSESTVPPYTKYWKSRWEQNGVYSADRFSQYEYFNLALSLYDRIDLLATLNAGGIAPRPKPYNTKGFIGVISKAINDKSPMLYCDSTGHLQSVTVCVAPEGNNFKDCSLPPTHNCPAAQSYFFPAAPVAFTRSSARPRLEERVDQLLNKISLLLERTPYAVA